MPLTPEQRKLRARAAAHTMHSQVVDPSEHTAPARKAFQARFYDGLDGLPVAERERIAAHRKSAYYSQLALRSSKRRRLVRTD